MIVCGICQGVDKMQFSKWHNWPKIAQKSCTKIKPALTAVGRGESGTGAREVPVPLAVPYCGRTAWIGSCVYRPRLKLGAAVSPCPPRIDLYMRNILIGKFNCLKTKCMHQILFPSWKTTCTCFLDLGSKCLFPCSAQVRST